jgi:hypothetical protein
MQVKSEALKGRFCGRAIRRWFEKIESDRHFIDRELNRHILRNAPSGLPDQ